jgi:ABC-type transport system substrate-binding protein
MRHSIFASLALASLLALDAAGARPRYGGTLRVAVEGTLRTLDADSPMTAAADVALASGALPLVFETLVDLNPAGGLDPGMASSWEREASGLWRVRLRPGLVRHDGTVIDAGQVAAIVRVKFPNWQVSSTSDALLINPGAGPVDVPWALADRAGALAWRLASGDWVGTGPFRVARLEPTLLALEAFERHWRGRPFVDQVQVAMGRALSAQRSDIEAGRLDMASALPADVRRLTQRGLKVVASRPNTLLALVFEPHRATNVHDVARTALAEAFDRDAIARTLLQGHAEPARALLPDWVSGYGEMVVRATGPAPARAALAGLPQERRALVLRVSRTDLLAQAVAQRLVVDATEAGFAVSLQVPSGSLAPRTDLTLVRLPIRASTPDRALAVMMGALGARTLAQTTRTAPGAGASTEEVARIERALLERRVIVPVVHVRELSVLGHRVASADGMPVSAAGVWNLADVWLNDATTAP